FFQAEDGIRDWSVTGVQTCALPIYDATAVEATFRDALAVARRQGARVYELRIATAYARFLREHHRSAEACALLAPAYAALTEGFDTPDLTEARQLLEELREIGG